MKYLALIGAFLAFLVPTAHALAPTEKTSAIIVPAPKVLTAPELARSIALEHGLNADTFVLVMQKESNNWENGQSRVPHKGGPNDREDSWGDCQIHLPAHPTITKEQALDPEWCFEWSANQWSKGNANLWTEWRKLQ